VLLVEVKSSTHEMQVKEIKWLALELLVCVMNVSAYKSCVNLANFKLLQFLKVS